MYQEKVYRQVDGVAMGSPLAPTLANLFMAHHEQTWTQSQHAPLTYFRYVDDIFCIFEGSVENEQHSKFLEHLNSRHENLTFTIDVEPSTLPFLDVCVESHDGTLNLSVFRKPTYTGLLLNFRATCPMQWKRGLIACFVSRAFRICNSWSSLHKEFHIIRKYFLQNGYPFKFIQDNINKCILKNVIRATSPDITNHSDNICITLPYFGQTSDHFRKSLIRFFRQHRLDISVTFKPYKVGTYFSLKSSVPYFLRADVVYKYVCPVDPEISYIGKTSRQLCRRVREHFTPEKNSPICNHILSCTCTHSIDNFSILKSARSDYQLSILEALYIREYRPPLNNMLANGGSSFYLRLF